METAKGAAQSDLKEFFHVGRTLASGHPLAARMTPNVWPDDLPMFAPVMQDLYAALEAAGSRILEAIAVGLGLPRDGFAAAVFEGNSVLRLLHYPPVAEGARGVRAAAHADINVITLLLGADEAGLELLSADGVWLTVEAPPGTLVCNVGDMLERKTGGRLPSTRHRVVNPVGPRGLVSRVSMPFFLHFRPDHLIVPDPPRADMPPILAHDFLLQRLREIRLSHDGSA